jgi:putative heme-binding domain-containing protein
VRHRALLVALVVCACGARAARPARAPATVAPEPEAESIARGADLFTARGCVACHSIGAGLRVGPDLAGLAERRGPDWIVGMITRPDSMLRHDSVARDLARKYGTTMPRLGIGPDEAHALVAFIGGERSTAPSEEIESRSCPCPACGRHRHAGRAMLGG